MPEHTQDTEPQGSDSPKEPDQEQLAGKGFWQTHSPLHQAPSSPQTPALPVPQGKAVFGHLQGKGLADGEPGLPPAPSLPRVTAPAPSLRALPLPRAEVGMLRLLWEERLCSGLSPLLTNSTGIPTSLITPFGTQSPQGSLRPRGAPRVRRIPRIPRSHTAACAQLLQSCHSTDPAQPKPLQGAGLQEEECWLPKQASQSTTHFQPYII